ncbi:MAG: AEC family transporter [Nitrospiraceae bacterium]|nr:AEC family transporter [Nitrospiraceae bacterium]
MYDLLLPFGLVILGGVIFKRLRFPGVDAESVRDAINAAVLNIFLPALCVKAVYTARVDARLFLVPLTSWATTLASLLLSLGVYALVGKKMRITAAEKGVLVLGATFGNVLYLGLPVLTGLYGSEAAKYALFYDLLAATPVLWIFGAALASRHGEGRGTTALQSLKIIATLPPIWGIAVGFCLKLAAVPVPAVLMKTFGMLGETVVPLMLFSVGLALSLPKVKHAVVALPAVCMKLLIAPFLALLAGHFLGLKGEPLAACAIEGGMPTMILSLLIAARFKLDVPLAAFLIVVTTALFFFTLPMIIYVTGFLP